MEMAMSANNRADVLGVIGSPRHHGNTEVLVDQVLRGAEEAGARTEKVVLSTLKISPCNACQVCQKTGQCVHDDDMTALATRMQHSRVWVLGTPVYWFGPTAQLKTFVDRWYGLRFGNTVDFKGRRIILVVPMGDPELDVARHTIGMLTDTVNWLDAEVIATLIVPDVLEKAAVHGHPDILEAALQAGREAIEA
jgi:multimeric flavodoxin WrbA